MAGLEYIQDGPRETKKTTSRRATVPAPLTPGPPTPYPSAPHPDPSVSGGTSGGSDRSHRSHTGLWLTSTRSRYRRGRAADSVCTESRRGPGTEVRSGGDTGTLSGRLDGETREAPRVTGPRTGGLPQGPIGSIPVTGRGSDKSGDPPTPVPVTPPRRSRPVLRGSGVHDDGRPGDSGAHYPGLYLLSGVETLVVLHRPQLLIRQRGVLPEPHTSTRRPGRATT